MVLLRRTDRFSANRAKLCGFYGQFPNLESLARWPELEGPSEVAAPYPSILSYCSPTYLPYMP